MSVKQGRVYLVGAGCGELDLITLRGRALLQRCDAVVYDSLIDERLLGFTRRDCERICVGKRSGRHSEKQENINAILVRKAREGKTVVRLKGGDPFVFGRGGEEILALQSENIGYAVVPGITSAVAVPELAGIPVTHRGISRSFHVITGHTKEDHTPEKLAAFAKLDGTLVFLMGLAHLDEIASELIKNGKDKNTPAAVISNGASRSQRMVKGTLESIYQDVQSAKLAAPAVIVIGDTAGYDMSPTVREPLQNVSVTVTGTRSFVTKLCCKLASQGANAVPLDFLKVKEYEDNAPLDDALRNIDRYSVIVLTSINGADIFFGRLRRLGIDIRTLSGVRFAVIGSGTAEALKKHGVFPDIMPTEFTTRALAEKLAGAAHDSDRLLLLRAEKGSRELDEILTAHGVSFREIKLYDIVPDGGEPTTTATDYITFASASGVQAFFESGHTVSEHTQIVCIGDVTADMLAKYVRGGCDIAKTSSSEGIVELIKEREHEKIQTASLE